MTSPSPSGPPSSAPYAAALAEYWADDFRPLAAAGAAVRRALREDEAAPDADPYRQLTDDRGRHLYFAEEPDGPSLPAAALAGPQPRVVHRRSVPLPPIIVEELRRSVKQYSFMGILAPAALVWVSCDKKLFLWPFDRKAGAHTLEANSPIITVGLVKPRKDIWPSVEWILVVTTPEEVMQLLLYRSDDDAAYTIRASSFNLPTDGVRLLSVAGTDGGRILLGGEDGCVYEIVYQGAGAGAGQRTEQDILNSFYDRGEETEDVISLDGSASVAGNIAHFGKRLFGVNGTSSRTMSGQPPKCRKLNRSTSSWASAVVPDVLLNMYRNMVATGGGPIVKMIVDEDRRTLYTLSRSGYICAFSLEKDTVKKAATMETPLAVQKYLEAVSRGQLNPPRGGGWGYISFNGNGLAAQAGVGGMEGARAILKNAAMPTKQLNGSTSKYDSSLVPVSIHVISPAESQRLTLLAVTGSGLRLYLSSLSPNSKTQLPSAQLTLCHIRAPPPMNATDEMVSLLGESDFENGIRPYVPGLNATLRLDASFYKQGVFLAALERKKTQRDGGVQAVGDTILATYPDSSYRNLEKVGRNETQRERKIPGGIVENMVLPMQQVFGLNGDEPAVLPGGVVIEMADLPGRERTSLALSINSLTPSDHELNVGIPAEYLPQASRRNRANIRGLERKEDIERTTTSVAIRGDSVSGTILSLLVQVLPSTVFARTIRQGVPIPHQGSVRLDSDKKLESLYRLSNRDGTDGFSVTAIERSRYAAGTANSRKTPSTPRSVRLQEWLLRPSKVPLSQLATQHFSEPTKEVLALNAGGLHYFAVSNVLVMLAEALMSSGESVASDPSVTRFFTKYGYKEGCAMCLSLAAGCGPADGGSPAAIQLRERAATAAIARSYSPKLVQNNGAGDAMIHSLTSADPIVPSGYLFCPSELCKGLTALLSRLLRPVWFKPAVVVTEGRIIRKAWSSAERMTPAKVEVLLSRYKIEQIHRPLANLLLVMRKLFTRALVTVPGMSHESSMDTSDDMMDETYVTNALMYQHQRHADRNGSDGSLKPSECERLARLIEERDIHSHYRLASRAVQVLSLVSLLYRAQETSELHEVEWGLLHGLTFAQLVESRDGQDRVERLLNSLVTASAADGFGKVAPSILVDQIADQFAKECYNYFSHGSRSAFLGFLRANEALENAIGSSRRLTLTHQAANHFRDAAKHWSNAPVITGRILHSRGTESFEDVASRAFQYRSPLAKACESLLRLGDVATAVEICLLTASNFHKVQNGLIDHRALFSHERNSVATYAWEEQLYLKPWDANSGRLSLSGSSAGVSSPGNIVAGGVSVSPNDAVDTCYSLIFFFFAQLMKLGEQEKAYSLVSSCTATIDRNFLHRFFAFLLENGYVETLLLIESPMVEEWLREHHDEELLWRYYTIQQRSLEAGEICFARATDVNSALTLDERIDNLSRAVNAFKTKVEEAQNIAFSSIDGAAQNLLASYQEKYNFARDASRIARIQKQILTAVDIRRGVNEAVDLSDDSYDRLAKKLVSASDLYNDFAARLYLFEHCLRILHACNHNETLEIHRLWANMIAEEILPCVTRDDRILKDLQVLFSDIGQTGDMRLLRPDESSDSLSLFEDGDWSRRVEARVVSLAQELYGTGADYVFPVDYLLDFLEALRRTSTNNIPESWSLVTLVRSGVRYLTLWDVYDAFCRRESLPGARLGAQQGSDEQFRNELNLLELWIDSARHGAVEGSIGNEAREELSQAIASGMLLPRIERLRATVQSYHDDANPLQRLERISDYIQYL